MERAKTTSKKRAAIFAAVGVVAILLLAALALGCARWVREDATLPAAGQDGLSAYELAVENGFAGSVTDWLHSLAGKSAYEIARDHGYTGSEADWADALTLRASQPAVGLQAAAFNAQGELLLTLSDGRTLNLGKAVGTDGKDGLAGKDGVDGKNGADGQNGVAVTDASWSARS